jgi:hypothetical protein
VVIAAVSRVETMDIQERRKKISQLKEELRILITYCPHQFPPYDLDKLDGSESATCIACGMHFGWFCPINPEHYCLYQDGDVFLCIFCGQPKERP